MLQLLNGTFCLVTNGCYGNGLLSDENGQKTAFIAEHFFSSIFKIQISNKVQMGEEE